jgi:hypothetical protein
LLGTATFGAVDTGLGAAGAGAAGFGGEAAWVGEEVVGLLSTFLTSLKQLPPFQWTADMVSI